VLVEEVEEMVDKGEEDEEVSVGDEEMDVIGMERKQIVMDVLVLPRCQRKRR